MINGAHALDHARRMHGKGVTGEVSLDWPELMGFKRSFTDPVPEKQERRYADKGIDTYHGRARFTGPNTLDVEGQSLEAENILIASGAEPIPMGIPGEEYLITNEGFLTLEKLPKKIVLVGGGYIAAEFSNLAARARAEVVVLQHGAQMLKHFDPELVGWLMASFKEAGIQVHTGTQVEAIEKSGEGYRVQAASGAQKLQFEADCVIHAAGRAPDLDALNLEAAGVATEGGKLKLNEYLQSVSNPAVYAAGDAAQIGPPLTPVSSHDAKVVVANLLEGNHQVPNYQGVPSVAFTIPPIASVGLSEAQAREQGLKFSLKSELASGWFTARQAAESVYGFKVLVEQESGRILGAHLVGPNVDEVINLFALAIRHGLKADDIKSTMFAYPTGASDIGYML
ncbi:NAD(P)/FAD-dependent oxidoreductase [Pseudomonas sp. SCT]